MIVRRLLAAALLTLALVGCNRATTGPRASAAADTACRAEVDRVYQAQNRRDLTYRDQRDTPFASSYFAGDTPRGLASEYGRGNQYSSCIANSTTPGAAGQTSPAGGNIGPVFSPAARTTGE